MLCTGDSDEKHVKNDAAAEYCNDDDTHMSSQWWAEFVKEGDKFNLSLSGKFMLLMEILRSSEAIGDKV